MLPCFTKPFWVCWENVEHLRVDRSHSWPSLLAGFSGGAELASERSLCISSHAPPCSLSHTQISVTHFHVFSPSPRHATLASFALHRISHSSLFLPLSSFLLFSLVQHTNEIRWHGIHSIWLTDRGWHESCGSCRRALKYYYFAWFFVSVLWWNIAQL